MIIIIRRFLRSHDAANALRQLRIKQKWLQFVSERVQRYDYLYLKGRGKKKGGMKGWMDERDEGTPTPPRNNFLVMAITVNCLQYLVTGSTLTAVGLFRLPAPQSGTLSRISSGTQPSVRTVSDGCLKRTCSLDTSAFSALEVLTTTALYKFTYLLT